MNDEAGAAAPPDRSATADVAEMHWSRWGDPTIAAPLTGGMRAMVERLFGLEDAPALRRSDVRLPPPALPDELVDGLRRVVGSDHVLDDDGLRLLRTRGKSTPDLLLVRAGHLAGAPDAVLRPGSHDEVAAVLSYCAEHRIAVVPFGGGTSVVTGTTAEREGYAGVVSLDLGRMDRLLLVDEVSMTATLEPGLRGPQAESLLAERGFTLGHFPQSFEFATIGGFAATRSSGQASAGYGRFDAMVLGIRLATPTGSLQLGRAPASAIGPDLRQLVLGSEGAFGVITAVTVRVRPLPAVRAYEGWSFESFGRGLQALRRLAQAQLLPTVLRLSDESESALSLPPVSDADHAHGRRCLLVAGYEGESEAVSLRRAAVAALLTEGGGTALGAAPGETWRAGRFAGPYLRDSMLDVGVLVETVETATFWSGVDDLYTRVRQVLADALGADGAPVLVLGHVSHVYETGCSLYFTVVAATGADPVAHWTRAKAAVSDAILAAGGTISHHHGVGRDHKRWLAEELGPVGVRMLRAVKNELDPQGVMNPGVLVP